MSLELTILGFLSWNPQSGYDLKKNFSRIEFIPWSGNNNQIYKTLIKLDSEGLVETVLDHEKTGPVRKIYSLTEQGRTALKTELLKEPEADVVKSTFLVQLAFTEILETRLILNLLDDYAALLGQKILLQEEEIRRGTLSPRRSEREALIWSSITGRGLDALKTDRSWALNLRKELENKYA